MAEPRVPYRIVNEHGELVKMEMPPDVFADGVWWRRPRGWYGPPPTMTPNKEALRQLRAKLADLEQQEDELNGS